MILYYIIFLIPVVTAQIFNPIAELVILIEIPTKAKAETEIHPVSVEVKIKCLIEFRVQQTFLCFLFINSFCSISSCFIYIFQSKFLAYVFFKHVFKVIIYF